VIGAQQASQVELIPGFLLALFCGAFIGIEREFGKAAKSEATDADGAGTPAGVRSHILTAVLGWTSYVLDRSMALNSAGWIAGFAALTAITATAYGIRGIRTGHYGITSAVTLLLTFLLGALVQTPLRLVAVGVAVAATATLAIKAPLHRFVRALTPQEIGAAIQLGLVALVLLPWLPDRDLGPLDAGPLARLLRDFGVDDATLGKLEVFNPFKLWALVVAISAIGFAGYVLVRSMGPRRGMALTGTLGGFVSSTAVTLSVAQQSKHLPQLSGPLVSAVLSACTVMALRVFVLVALFAPSLTVASAWTMFPMAGTTALGAILQSRTKPSEEPSAHGLAVTTPFALWPALQFAGLFFLIRVGAKLVLLVFGGAGLMATAVVSGTVDVDAISVAIAQEFASQSTHITENLALAAVFAAVASNSVVKAGLGLSLGARAVARPAAAWLSASIVAGGAGLAAALAWK